MQLRFESRLAAPPDRVWAWITSVDGIGAELWPVLKMTVPAEVRNLRDVTIVPGRPLFRSWVLLFGLLPIDRSDLTLIELQDGKGFLEESPMLSMKLWRHERRLSPDGDTTVLTDTLTFEPRFAGPLVRWFIGTVFRHRHQVLRRSLGHAAPGRAAATSP